MTKIEKFEYQVVRIPLRKPVVFAAGVLTEAAHLLLEIADSDGVTGHAEVIPRPMIYGDTVSSAGAVLDEEIRPLVLGQRAEAPAAIMKSLARVVGNYVIKGAVDMALHDLSCRRANVSCHSVLGGFTDRVVVTVMLGAGEPGAMAAEAVEAHERYGANSYKVKVGFDVVRDVAAVRAVRAAVPDALIYVDANHGYSGLQARRFVELTSELGVAWMEEPTDADRPLERERFRRESGMPILGDESCVTAGAVAREALAGRIDLVSLKVARTGYSVSDQIRGFCESTGIVPVMGNQGDSGLGTLCSLAYGAAHESTSAEPGEYTYFLELTDDILAEPLQIAGGRLAVPPGPGNGAVLDRDKIDFYGRTR
jgi:L-alanine-DL-glutamate epimerase-like enolase superfamily enzyme